VGPGRPAVVVLTHTLWQRRFGGDAAVVGRAVRLNGQPFTVIGVMGADFNLVRNGSLESPEGADAYTTLDDDVATLDPGSGSFAGLVRARRGAAPEAVTAAVDAVGRMVDRRDFEGRGLRLYPVGMGADLVAGVRPALVVLGAAGVLLVLVLAINMANLLLVRAAQRDQEFAVSRALGANPLALARATLLEAALLGVIGGACGALVATWATRALVALAPLNLPRRESIAVDLRIALVVVGVGLLLGLFAGAAPAVWATRTQLAALLRNAAVRGGGGAQGRLRRAMVVAQVALSLVLLTAGGLVVRSFEQLLRANPGFDPRGVLTLRVPAVASRYPSDTSVAALHARVERELAALPGVTAVGGATALPLTADANQMTIDFPGAPGNTGVEDHDEPLVDVMAARAGYFDALGIRRVAGPGFSTGPRAGVREAVIDRTLADYFFPTGEPGGLPPAVRRRHADHRRRRRARAPVRRPRGRPPAAVLPRRVRPGPRALVRTAHRARPVVARAGGARRDPPHRPTARRRGAAADGRRREAGAPAAARERGAHRRLLHRRAPPRRDGALRGGAGSVNRRRHEIAVRLALGAGHGSVLRLVLQEGRGARGARARARRAGDLLRGRVLRGVLVGVSPFDPVTLGAVAAGLAVVALLACYVPGAARRDDRAGAGVPGRLTAPARRAAWRPHTRPRVRRDPGGPRPYPAPVVTRRCSDPSALRQRARPRVWRGGRSRWSAWACSRGCAPARPVAARGGDGSGLPPSHASAGAAAAELFAPGVISDAKRQWRITFTADGRTAYFAESEGFFPATRQATIHVTRRVDGAWTEPEVAPFSGRYSDIDPFVTPDGSRLYFSSIRPWTACCAATSTSGTSSGRRRGGASPFASGRR
jgi:hypothetical protein